MKNKAIIIGAPGRHTLGMARSLGEENIDVYLILRSKKNHYVQKSKYVKKSWLVDDDFEMILKVLMDNFSKCTEKAVLFPGNETDVAFIGKYYNVLQERFIFPTIKGSGAEFNDLLDKDNVNKIAEELHIKVPQSWVVNNFQERIEIPENIVYPCFVKALNSVGNYGKEHMRKCESVDDLIQAIAAYNSIEKPVIIQEFLAKDYEVVVGGCALSNYSVVVPGIIEKEREFTESFGLPSFARVSSRKNNIYYEIVSKILTKIGYSGLFDIEFIYANGKDYLLEINFRNGGDSYSYTKAGVNTPYMWYLDAVGEDVTSMNTVIKKDIYMMVEFADFKHVLKGNISLLRWLKDLLKTRAFMLFNLSDIFPFIFEFKRALSDIIISKQSKDKNNK